MQAPLDDANLDGAMARLQAAIDLLDSAVRRRLDAEHRRGDLDVELQIMQDDRARLAVDLESAAERLGQVEAVTRHVGPRIQRAIGAIRDVLQRADAPLTGSS